ncbi:hypothetical protein BC835DRAFT_1336611 [Cytidiella melzeri]|nr:hypothetical protein BC835DRAFT_1336611 [Cytidiella melzeri]
MATLEYVEVPAAATRLQSRERTSDLRPAMNIATALPGFPIRRKCLGLYTFSSAIPLPANAPATSRASQHTLKLLSTKHPLSVPITTVNFKRFVSKWFCVLAPGSFGG